MIYVMRTDDRAKMPSVGTPGSVGLDLYALEAELVVPGSPSIVRSGIAIQLPTGYEAQVRGRSGLALRGIMCHVGTIDTDYRGEINAILYNVTDEPFLIDEGDRFAQLVICPVAAPNVTPVFALPGDTVRGAGGFGSTGR